MKELYGIDMEKTQYSKLISDIPEPDIAISMGCDVGCPYIGRAFDDNWGLPDPTGQSDEVFIRIIHSIEEKLKVIDQLSIHLILFGRRRNLPQGAWDYPKIQKCASRLQGWDAHFPGVSCSIIHTRGTDFTSICNAYSFYE